MQNKEQLKQTLINKIKQTRQGRKIPKLNEYPLEAIQEMYDARVKNFQLSEKEFSKWILSKSFYANGANLAIVAYVLNLTTERVRQIEQRAIKKLNHPIIGKSLRALQRKILAYNNIQVFLI